MGTNSKPCRAPARTTFNIWLLPSYFPAANPPSRLCHPSRAGRNSQDAHSILQNADFLSLHQQIREALRHLPATISCPLKPDNQSAGGCWLALQQEQQHTHTHTPSTYCCPFPQERVRFVHEQQEAAKGKHCRVTGHG